MQCQNLETQFSRKQAQNWVRREIMANPMSGVFKILTPHLSHCPASVYPPPVVQGEDTLAGWRGGWGVNILEDVRHSSVLYVSTLCLNA